MKRNAYGMSHKVKGSMEMGLIYPVLVQEMIPGDIMRVRPEVLIKSVVPPVTQLTDKISWKLEASFTPNRLVDDEFVRNISTTKTGEVKGNFKSISLGQIADRFGSFYRRNIFKPGYLGEGRIIWKEPVAFKHRKISDGVSSGVIDFDEKCRVYRSPRRDPSNPSEPLLTDRGCYQEALPTYFEKYNGESPETGVHCCAPFFGQGSLNDWLGLHPDGNLGQNTDLDSVKFNTYAISSYYMFINFYHTIPEYEKYVAPPFDYPKIDDDFAYSEGCKRLHRYETLEEEFGNEFEYPSLSGRSVNGLIVDNWVPNDYFSKTMKDPQRGIAPSVPVSIVGVSNVLCPPFSGESSVNVGVFNDGSVELKRSQYDTSFMNVFGESFEGSFEISDLRSALALQHFQEDTQECFKWTDFLQKVYGTSPVDSLADQPVYIGSATGLLSCSEVIQSAETSEGSLGDIGGKLSGYGSGKTFTYNAREHGTFMITLVLKPERNYESGTERQFTRMNYLDMYFPQFVGIGNQAIRCDELLCCVGDSDRQSNWGFVSRCEEFRHRRNRVVGKCRNNSMLTPNITDDPNRKYLSVAQAQESGLNNIYLNDFHPYAIGDAYSKGWDSNERTVLGCSFDSNCQDFLLCTPQLNDIFVDDSEEPFLVVLGFNMDMFRPIPVFTKPGLSYV